MLVLTLPAACYPTPFPSAVLVCAMYHLSALCRCGKRPPPMSLSVGGEGGLGGLRWHHFGKSCRWQGSAPCW